MPQLEFGDKVVLPPQILLELQCFKIPTPLLFQVRPTNTSDDAAESTQYCSVQEFSAPDGTAFLPYWMMQNMGLEEGGNAIVTSIINVPRGVYCRLQPDSTAFLDLAAEIGPKLLMENALRRYSVLSSNSTIVIIHGGNKFFVRVVELRPASVVTLCGDVDLETDFMAPEQSDLKRPRSQESIKVQQQELQPVQPEAMVPLTEALPNDCVASMPEGALSNASIGRRLRDGGYILDSQPASTESYSNAAGQVSTTTLPKRSVTSLQKAQERVRERNATKAISTDVMASLSTETSIARHLRHAQPSFASNGHHLNVTQSAQEENPAEEAQVSKTATDPIGAPPPQEATACPFCFANIPETAKDLHTLRCARNPAYHKFACSDCHEQILISLKERHLHCHHCAVICSGQNELQEHMDEEHTASSRCTSCGSSFTRTGLREHTARNECEHAFVPCSACGFSFKRKDTADHLRYCSNRTERCDICQAFVKLTDMDVHLTKHSDELSNQTTPANPALNGAPTPASDPSDDHRLESRLECVYCSATGFSDVASVEQHVLHACRVAQSFSAFSPAKQTTDQRADVVPSSVRDLVQGRLRRKNDASLLRRNFPSNNRPLPSNQDTPPISSLHVEAAAQQEPHPVAPKASVPSSVNRTVRKKKAVNQPLAPLATSSSSAARTKAPQHLGTSPDLLCIQSASLQVSNAAGKARTSGRWPSDPLMARRR